MQDFTKSTNLIEDEYTVAVERLNDMKELAAKEEEIMRIEKDSFWLRKATKKEACSIAIAKAQAHHVEEKEEATRLKVLRTSEAAAARDAESMEKAGMASTHLR